MKQKTFRFFLDLMLLVCLALAGCGLQAYAQAQLSVSLLITPAFLLLAGGAFELGRLLHALRVYDVRGLREQHFTLEQHFKNVYLKGEN